MTAKPQVFPRQSQPFHVLAKPTGPKCNLQCEYCFYKPKEEDVYAQEHQRNQLNMDVALLEQFVPSYIEQQADAPGDINFLWQGGEPTMRGIGFFQRAVELQRKYCPPGRRIANHFQTNGILINQRWAEFFAEHQFLIGLSIDGPQFIHDMYRKTTSGGGSFNQVITGLEWLQRYSVPYNTMTVVGRHNQQSGGQVYETLKALGSKHMQFIPLVERFDPQQQLSAPPDASDPRQHQVTRWSVSPNGYGHFLNGVFDAWLKEDVGSVSVQLFDVLLGVWRGQPSSLCVHAKNCGAGVVMEHNGDVYSCDHYVYPEYLLGNAYQDDLAALVHGETQQQFGRDKYDTLPQQCLSCDYLKACYGGCPKHRFDTSRDGQPGLNYLCKSYRMFFDHAGPWIHRIAQLQRAGYPAEAIYQQANQLNPVPSSGRNQPCHCGSGAKFKRCCGRS